MIGSNRYEETSYEDSPVSGLSALQRRAYFLTLSELLQDDHFFALIADEVCSHMRTGKHGQLTSLRKLHDGEAYLTMSQVMDKVMKDLKGRTPKEALEDRREGDTFLELDINDPAIAKVVADIVKIEQEKGRNDTIDNREGAIWRRMIDDSMAWIGKDQRRKDYFAALDVVRYSEAFAHFVGVYAIGSMRTTYEHPRAENVEDRGREYLTGYGDLDEFGAFGFIIESFSHIMSRIAVLQVDPDDKREKGQMLAIDENGQLTLDKSASTVYDLRDNWYVPGKDGPAAPALQSLDSSVETVYLSDGAAPRVAR